MTLPIILIKTSSAYSVNYVLWNCKHAAAVIRKQIYVTAMKMHACIL